MPIQRDARPGKSLLGPAVLSPVRAIFRAVTMTIVPDAAHLDEQRWAELEELVEDALQNRPETHQQLRLLLRVIRWAPVFRYGRSFTALDLPSRERFLSYLQDHPIQKVRSGFWGLRTLALLGYYGRPEAAQAVGYTPDVRGWDAPR
jgi:hypothetical protein